MSDNPRGVNIRYKMVQRGATTPATTATTTATGKALFGLQVERMITTRDANRDGVVAFRFENNLPFMPPENVTGHFRKPETRGFTPELKQWMKDEKVDLLLHLGEKDYDVLSLDMRDGFAGQPAEWETISPDQAAPLLAKMEKLNTYPGPRIAGGTGYRDGSSGVEVFRTRDGTVGFYQLRGLSDPEGHGVVIRYKLVMADQAKPASAISVAPPTFGPIVHCFIARGKTKQSFYSIERDAYVEAPESLPEIPRGLDQSPEAKAVLDQYAKWLADNDVDFLMQPTTGNENTLALANMIARPVMEEQFADSIPKLMDSFKDNLAAEQRLSSPLVPLLFNISANSGDPITAIFKTRKGRIGILQVHRANERGLDVRYKLLQDTAKPSANAAALVFGPEVNGLQAALELRGAEGGSYTLGQPIEVRFHIRNASKDHVHIADESWRAVNANDLTIKDAKGQKLEVAGVLYTGIAIIQRVYLQPGESTVFHSGALEFLPETADTSEAKHPVVNYLNAKPGRYTVSYHLRIPEVVIGDNSVDWKGELDTAPVTIEVKAAGAATTGDAATLPKFGPVMERTLNYRRSRAEAHDALRLSDGTVSKLPSGFFERGEQTNHQWLTDGGSKIFPGFAIFPDEPPGPHSWGLGSADVEFSLLPDEAWNNPTTERINTAFADKNNALRQWFTQGARIHCLSAVAKWPATLAFRAGDGSVGVLQILEINEADPQAPIQMKLRYKLVQQGEAKPSASATPSPALGDSGSADASAKFTEELGVIMQQKARTMIDWKSTRKALAVLHEKPGVPEAERQAGETKLKEQLRELETNLAQLEKDRAALEAKTAALQRSQLQPVAPPNVDAERDEQRALDLVEKFHAPMELVQAEIYKDGGTLGFVFKDAQGNRLEFCVDHQEDTKTDGRLFVGAQHPDKPEAILAASSGKAEKQVRSLLKAWMKEHITEQVRAKELQSRDRFIELSDAERQQCFVIRAANTLEKRNSTARLQFRFITDEKDANAETLTRRGGTWQVRVSREALLDETSVSSASAGDLGPGRSISLKFTEAGARKFAEITGANIGRQLAIVFDGKLMAEPTITAAITEGSVLITGSFKDGEAESLATAMTTVIQAPAKLVEACVIFTQLPADVRRHPATELFINNHKFGADNGCSSDVPLSGQSTCGHPGHVSEVTWKFLRTGDAGDVYEITRKYPSDTATAKTETKEVTYAGGQQVLWQDDFQKITLRPKPTQPDPSKP